MKKSVKAIGLPFIFSVLIGCTNSTNNNTNTVEQSPAEAVPSVSPPQETPTEEPIAPSNSQTQTSKTDAEIYLEASSLALSTISDLAERKRVKDSIRQANKTKMFAYKIGVKMKQNDAYKAYIKMSKKKTSNIYVFKAARKEYYLVKFEAKQEDELIRLKNDVSSQLGEFANEGIEIINLNDFCSAKETITKTSDTENGFEIKCLICD